MINKAVVTILFCFCYSINLSAQVDTLKPEFLSLSSLSSYQHGCGFRIIDGKFTNDTSESRASLIKKGILPDSLSVQTFDWLSESRIRYVGLKHRSDRDFYNYLPVDDIYIREVDLTNNVVTKEWKLLKVSAVPGIKYSYMNGNLAILMLTPNKLSKINGDEIQLLNADTFLHPLVLIFDDKLNLKKSSVLPVSMQLFSDLDCHLQFTLLRNDNISFFLETPLFAEIKGHLFKSPFVKLQELNQVFPLNRYLDRPYIIACFNTSDSLLWIRNIDFQGTLFGGIKFQHLNNQFIISGKCHSDIYIGNKKFDITSDKSKSTSKALYAVPAAFIILLQPEQIDSVKIFHYWDRTIRSVFSDGQQLFATGVADRSPKFIQRDIGCIWSVDDGKLHCFPADVSVNDIHIICFPGPGQLLVRLKLNGPLVETSESVNDVLANRKRSFCLVRL